MYIGGLVNESLIASEVVWKSEGVGALVWESGSCGAGSGVSSGSAGSGGVATRVGGEPGGVGDNSSIRPTVSASTSSLFNTGCVFLFPHLDGRPRWAALGLIFGSFGPFAALVLVLALALSGLGPLKCLVELRGFELDVWRFLALVSVGVAGVRGVAVMVEPTERATRSPLAG